jgi:aminoglycoside 6-adenylyltransferase
MEHQRILDEIIAWAREEATIRAVILTGSAARGFQHLHRLSDLDVELYVDDPALLLEDESWYRQFGTVLVVEALSNPGWHPTRLVYYVDGKIDFMVGPTAALATTSYTRPFRVVLDKDGTTRNIPPVSPRAAGKPDAETFSDSIHWFYAAALMCSKCIVRDDRWQAKWRDWDLKTQLLRMIEWDHKVRYGWDNDTWSRGKHLNAWLDADILAEVAACWAGFDRSDMVNALLASVELFDRLTARTARALRLPGFDSSMVRHEIVAIVSLPWEG